MYDPGPEFTVKYKDYSRTFKDHIYDIKGELYYSKGAFL